MDKIIIDMENKQINLTSFAAYIKEGRWHEALQFIKGVDTHRKAAVEIARAGFLMHSNSHEELIVEIEAVLKRRKKTFAKLSREDYVLSVAKAVNKKYQVEGREALELLKTNPLKRDYMWATGLPFDQAAAYLMRHIDVPARDAGKNGGIKWFFAKGT